MTFSKRSTKTKKTSRKKGKRSGGGVLSLWIEVAAFLALSFFLYVLASIFSLKTGVWGEQIRFSLLRNWGGAVIIPVLFAGHVCFAYFLKSGARGFLRQLLGTFLLFLCTALLLGLFKTAGLFQRTALLTPGYLGEGMAIFLTRTVGSLGAILLGIALLVLSASLYGFIQPAAVVRKIIHLARTLVIKTGAPMPFPENLRSPSRPPEDESAEEEKRTPPPWFFQPLLEEGDPLDEGEIAPVETPAPDEEPEVLTTPSLPLVEAEGEEPFDAGDTPGDEDDFSIPAEDVAEEPSVPKEREEEEPPREVISYQEGLDDDGTKEDPHALSEIDFNEIDGTERGVLGAPFPPPVDVFGPRQQLESSETNLKVQEQADGIINTLADFSVGAEMADVVIGPTVIQFQIQLAPGIKVSKVAGLSNDLAVALAVPSLRVEAPIPGKPYVGVEIPNPKRKGISIRTVLESHTYQDNDYDLPLPMGVRVDSRPLVVGLEDLPHLLVAGTTGSGKSVFVTSCITGLSSFRTPDELRFILIDPKRVELSLYEHLPHVLAKPVVSPKKAVQALAWAVREMERRYEVFARARVRNLKSYNQAVLPKSQLPYIIIVVDELADLMFTAQKEVEDYICRLAQMARATGIHLILATQRPSVNVITGLIKANVPARVAFTLPSQTDSRTIIDISGAERLLGKGDMLFVSSKYPRPLRVQSPFIDDGKTLEIINYLRTVFGDPEYVDIEDQGGDAPAGGDTSFADDPLLEEAMDVVLDTGIASASRLQRQLRVGFTRAARLIDTMEQIGVVGPPEGSKPREILVDDEKARELLRSVLGDE